MEKNSHTESAKKPPATTPAEKSPAPVQGSEPLTSASAPASALQRAAAPPPNAPKPSDLLALQRSVGNRATTRMLKERGGSASRSRSRIQTKLTVGPAGDTYEQEADRVAAQVMRMPDPTGQRDLEAGTQPESATAGPPVAATVYRLVQRDSSSNGFEAGNEFENGLKQAPAGQPIPGSTRQFMETRMGADFSGVRLHVGRESAQLNRQVSAQAFTLGRDIYLGEGKANLATGAGKQLLAHELTHTIQQGAAPVQRKALTHTGEPVVQRLITSASLSQSVGLGKGLRPQAAQAEKKAAIPWWRRTFQSEAKQKAHLKSELRKEVEIIQADKLAARAQVTGHGDFTAISNLTDEQIDAKSLSELQTLLGKVQSIKKGMTQLKQMRSPDLVAGKQEFEKALDEYHRILNSSTAGGLLSAPEFVLDQVFEKHVVKDKHGKDKTVTGASAGNLDVGVGDVLAAHLDLMITAKDYVAFLRKKKANDLADMFEGYLPDIAEEKEFLYRGLKENREQTSMNLALAVNKGRESAGKADRGKLVGMPMGEGSDKLPKNTPLGYMAPEQVPGYSTMSEGPHREWLSAESKDEGERPDISEMSREKELGAGIEGEVSLYESSKMGKLGEGEGPEAMMDEDPRQFAVKTTRSGGRENLLKEMAAYKHLGRHRNLPQVHGMGAVQFGQDKRPAMVMDFVKGPTGEKAMRQLREKAAEIGPESYWGAIQFITRRLVDVIKHLSSKGLAHNDIKPENFMINDKGEPMLIDLGLHTLKGEGGDKIKGTTPSMAPAQITKQVTTGEETDLFMVATSMLAGVEGWREPKGWSDRDWSPRQGLQGGESGVSDESGTVGDRNMKAEYTQFVKKVIQKDAQATVTIAEAEELPFISRPLIGDDAARKVLVGLQTASKKDEMPWYGQNPEDVKPGEVPEGVKGRWAPREAGESARKRNAAAAKAKREAPTPV